MLGLHPHRSDHKTKEKKVKYDNIEDSIVYVGCGSTILEEVSA